MSFALPPILILDAYLDRVGGARNLLPHVSGRSVRVVRVAHEPVPQDPGECAAVLITGSAASVLEDRPWIADLERLVARAVEADTPVLGICFGHQVLARALLGPDSVRHSPTPELGGAEVECTAPDPLFQGVESRFRVFVSHADEVVGLPPTWPILARTARCAIHGYRVEDRRAWGVQFHAEMPHAEAAELVRARSPADTAESLVDSIPPQTATESVARRLVSNFLHLANSGEIE